METPESIVLSRRLTKRYGDLTAVDGVEFAIQPGECVGFLGPNGAGKTTTVRMVSCFTPITSGTVEVFGLDVSAHPREVKAGLGICPQEDNLDPDFSVERNLLVYGRYFGCRTGIPFLHFEVACYAGIERCIERGIPLFEAGAQGDHKLLRGFAPSPTYSSHWIRDPGLDRAVRDHLRREAVEVATRMKELARLGPYRRDGAPLAALSLTPPDGTE